MEEVGEEEGAGRAIVRAASDAKRAAVGVGARMLFYPTLVYNVVRNQFESHFHWWDQVDEVVATFLPLLIPVLSIRYPPVYVLIATPFGVHLSAASSFAL